ncbi:MAG: glycosyltransferase family 2 protein [Candidatus Levyibacteriota bacterium]
MDLSIISVSYNTKEFLKKLLVSIEENISSKVSYEVIVVDNASTDGSPSAISNLKSQMSKLKIILNKENYGFSKANNQGVKKTAKSRYVLFLNPDTLLEKGTIEKMIEFMDENRGAGASTCKVVMSNGQIDDATHRGFPTPWNSFTHFSGISKLMPKSTFLNGYYLGWKNIDKVHEIDALAGAFMLVRREAGEEVGWWDEDYFFYGEDIDFCFMLKQKGWKIYYVPTASIFHHKGASSGIKKISKETSTATRETKIRITKSRFNAMKIFYKKHYARKYPKFLTKLVTLGINAKLWYSLKRI